MPQPLTWSNNLEVVQKDRELILRTLTLSGRATGADAAVSSDAMSAFGQPSHGAAARSVSMTEKLFEVVQKTEKLDPL